MEREERNQEKTLDVDTLIELYKVADENHRFYVDKRFAVISLYFPLVTLVLSAVYVVAQAHYE